MHMYTDDFVWHVNDWYSSQFVITKWRWTWARRVVVDNVFPSHESNDIFLENYKNLKRFHFISIHVKERHRVPVKSLSFTIIVKWSSKISHLIQWMSEKEIDTLCQKVGRKIIRRHDIEDDDHINLDKIFIMTFFLTISRFQMCHLYFSIHWEVRASLHPDRS